MAGPIRFDKSIQRAALRVCNHVEPCVKARVTKVNGKTATVVMGEKSVSYPDIPILKSCYGHGNPNINIGDYVLVEFLKGLYGGAVIVSKYVDPDEDDPGSGGSVTPEEIYAAVTEYMEIHSEEFIGPTGATGAQGPAPTQSQVNAAVTQSMVTTGVTYYITNNLTEYQNAVASGVTQTKVDSGVSTWIVNNAAAFNSDITTAANAYLAAHVDTFRGLGYAGLTSATSITIGSLSVTNFTVNQTQGTNAFTVGDAVRVYSRSTPTKFINGVIAGYSGTTLSFQPNTSDYGGTGSFSDCNIILNAGMKGNTGNTGATGATGPGYQGLMVSGSNSIGTGSKSFPIVFQPPSVNAFSVGTRVRVFAQSAPTNWMEGLITTYTSSSFVVNVDLVGGSGTFSDWDVSLAGERGSIGLTGFGYAGLTSNTSGTPVLGSATLTVNQAQGTNAYVVGDRIRIAMTSSPTNFSEGVITAYTSTSLTVLIDLIGGSPSGSAWTITITGQQGTKGNTGDTNKRLIHSENVTNATNYTFTGLSGNKKYVIEGEINVTCATIDTWIMMQINGDTGSNYNTLFKMLSITGTTVGDVAPSASTDVGYYVGRTHNVAAGNMNIEELKITPDNSGYHLISTKTKFMNAINIHNRSETSGIHASTTEITSIKIYISNSKLMTGQLRLYEVDYN